MNINKKQKQILVIGSTVADIIIHLDHLPGTAEDVNITRQTMSLGGCAYNVFHTIRLFKVPCTLFSPVGSGVYGDFVRQSLSSQGIISPIPAPAQENGCCYCFVEKSGERTFISHHGAEYRFLPEWFELIDSASVGSVYLCGLELEEDTGVHIVHYLEQHLDFKIFFGPGPRILHIPKDLMRRLTALSPVLHLNESEALSYTGKSSAEEAAHALHQMTRNAVIITLGARGTYFYSGTEDTAAGACVPGVKAVQTDTIGAGDAHIGAVMAGLFKGASLETAIRDANRVSAAVVETEGALLPEEAFARLGLVPVCLPTIPGTSGISDAP